jgi:hypothetical protein
MKRVGLLIIISLVLFAGCSDTTIVVTNNTSKDITYTLRVYPNIESHVARAHDTNTHGAKNGLSHGLVNYVPSSLPESIYLETRGDTYTFNEIVIPIRVYNALKKDIELSAEGYLDTNPLVVNGEGEKNGLLYTKTPKFDAKTTDGYPANIAYVFDDNKCLVTVH